MIRRILLVMGLVLLVSACGARDGNMSQMTPVRLQAPDEQSQALPATTTSDTAATPAAPLDSAGAYIGRGIDYYGKGEFAKAIADYTDAIALEPKNIEAYINRGSAYVRNNDIPKALADYDKAIEIDPTMPESYTGRGAIHYMQQHFEDAVADFSKAIELKPDFTGAYYNRGLVYNSMGMADKATADFQKAIELNNDSFWKEQAVKELQKMQTAE